MEESGREEVVSGRVEVVSGRVEFQLRVMCVKVVMVRTGEGKVKVGEE